MSYLEYLNVCSVATRSALKVILTNRVYGLIDSLID